MMPEMTFCGGDGGGERAKDRVGFLEGGLVAPQIYIIESSVIELQ